MKQVTGFINTGLDEALSKSVASRAHLIPIQKQVTKNGRTFLQTFYVAPEDIKKEVRHQKTCDLYKDKSGNYKPERQKLHKQIVEDIIKSAGETNKTGKPVAILLGGGSASGKSTLRRTVVDETLKGKSMTAATVDSDEIKDRIPEFDLYKKQDAETAAYRVHEESSDISAYALDELIRGNKNFIFDGTMKNVKKYEDMVSRLKDAGYEVHIVIADVPLDVAIERSDARAKRSGRKVPHDIIKASHTGVPKTFTKLKDVVDSYSVFDNSGDSPELIASNDYKNPDKLKAFLNKGGVSYD